MIIVGALCWSLVWGTHILALPEPASNDTIGLMGALMFLDLVLGVVALSALPFRGRAALTIAIITSASLVFSSSAIGAAVFAVMHLAAIGSRLGVAITGAVWTIAALGNGALFLPSPGTASSTIEILSTGAVGLLIYIVLVAIARYRRARGETLMLLRERAENAERERERAVRAAQEAERLRIAREMHDVLAHRISLVSMHAGALTYREDLPRDKIAEAAHVIQDNTTQALTELRGLLGVLRESDGADLRMPQPGLEQLPSLLADARSAGVSVDVEFFGIEVVDEQPVILELNDATSRAAYRIVQEALTNARKHAPGEIIRIRIAHDDDQLRVESRNRMAKNNLAAEEHGMGLVGLTERTELANGTLTSGPFGDDFVMKAEMPWK